MWSGNTSDIVRQLKERGAKTVALQFPEGLKRRAAAIADALKEAGFDVIISGDPCYGACDLALDTLALADVLVHFGHAPVDTRENVIFEEVAMDFDTIALDAVIPHLGTGPVGLVTTVQHVRLLPGIARYLGNRGVTAVIAEGGEREAVVAADLDMKVLEDVREKIPVFRDRRPEVYRKR